MSDIQNIRRKIRKILMEDAYNLGTQMGDESSIDASTFDSAINSLQSSIENNRQKIDALKKQRGIKSHSDDSINRMMKNLDKNKMDNLDTETNNLQKSAEELEKAKSEFEKLSKEKEERKEKEGEVRDTQASITGAEGITNI